MAFTSLQVIKVQNNSGWKELPHSDNFFQDVVQLSLEELDLLLQSKDGDNVIQGYSF